MSPCKNLFWAAWEFYVGLADAIVLVHRAKPRQSHTNPSASYGLPSFRFSQTFPRARASALLSSRTSTLALIQAILLALRIAPLSKAF